MRIGDVLYFSPNHKFRNLNFDDPETIAVAFADRVNGFYFQAAEQLIETRHAFGAGLLTCAAIDFVADTCSEEKAETFLGGFLGLDADIAANVWKLFRHGLAHEGRVKPFGQFSFEVAAIVYQDGDAVIVNPDRLLRRAKESFAAFCGGASATRKKLMTDRLQHRFEREVRFAKALVPVHE